MPVVINGTTGITNVNGSAAAPAETGIDTDTGIYYGTNTVGLATNGTNALFIDASQNVGIGTSSPASKLHVAGSFRQTGATAPFEWTVNAGAADYLKLNAVGYADNLIVANSSGNVGIGTNLPTTKLNVSGGLAVQGTVGSFPTSGQGWEITGESATACAMQAYNRTAASWLDAKWYAGTHIWLTNGSERARIDSSGNLLVGATSTTWNGTLVRSAGTISLASGASINLSSSLCGGAIVSIYVTGSGNGGLFYLNYSATSVKLAGDGDTTDTGSNFAVYKNAASHVSTLKNKAGSTQTFSVVVVAGQLT